MSTPAATLSMAGSVIYISRPQFPYVSNETGHVDFQLKVTRVSGLICCNSSDGYKEAVENLEIQHRLRKMQNP